MSNTWQGRASTLIGAAPPFLLPFWTKCLAYPLTLCTVQSSDGHLMGPGSNFLPLINLVCVGAVFAYPTLLPVELGKLDMVVLLNWLVTWQVSMAEQMANMVSTICHPHLWRNRRSNRICL